MNKKIVSSQEELEGCVVINNCAALRTAQGEVAYASNEWGIATETVRNGALYREFYKGDTSVFLPCIYEEE
jgi:hypothetical protein